MTSLKLRTVWPLFILLCLAPMLGACSVFTDKPQPVVTKIEYRVPLIPASMFKCKPDPAKPALTGAKGEATFITDLWEVKVDCRAKLQAVGDLYKKFSTEGSKPLTSGGGEVGESAKPH